MKKIDTQLLKEAYRRHECNGIVRFLEFMEELEDVNERRDVYHHLMKGLGLKPKLDLDPFDFFNILNKQREGIGVFVDDGVKTLDLFCGKLADLWKETESN